MRGLAHDLVVVLDGHARDNVRDEVIRAGGNEVPEPRTVLTILGRIIDLIERVNTDAQEAIANLDERLDAIEKSHRG